MKPTTNPLGFFILTLILSLSLALPAALVRADAVRPAVWAGRFYEADPAELDRDIDRLTRKARKTRLQIPKNKTLKAIVMPHAGYIYSGWTAAHAAHVLSPDQYSKVIVTGSDPAFFKTLSWRISTGACYGWIRRRQAPRKSL